MFYECSKDFLLRLDQTLYVGDDPRDCEAAERAGSNSIYVGDIDELDKSQLTLPFSITSGISTAADQIIEFYNAA